MTGEIIAHCRGLDGFAVFLKATLADRSNREPQSPSWECEQKHSSYQRIKQPWGEMLHPIGGLLTTPSLDPYCVLKKSV